MAIFGSNNYLQLISDGDKVVIFNGEKQHYLIKSPYLSRFDIGIERPVIEVRKFGGDMYYESGLMGCTINLTLRGDRVQMIDHPLVMGVDIFDKFSVSDYLDIINEKIKVKS